MHISHFDNKIQMQIKGLYKIWHPSTDLPFRPDFYPFYDVIQTKSYLAKHHDYSFIYIFEEVESTEFHFWKKYYPLIFFIHRYGDFVDYYSLSSFLYPLLSILILDSIKFFPTTVSQDKDWNIYFSFPLVLEIYINT